MKSVFRILFSIEVLHDFYSTGRWADVRIIPLPETAKLLHQLDCITRQVDNELLVIAKTNDTRKMQRDMVLFEKFSFAIVPQTPNYINFSNFPFSKLNNPVLHFHNLNGNEFGGKHYISRGIADYATATDYAPGSFAKSLADGAIYECIRTNNNGGESIAPDDSQAEPALPANPEGKNYSKNYWAILGSKQYAGSNDTSQLFADAEYPVVIAGKVINTKATAAQQNHSVNVFAFNGITQNYDKEVLVKAIVYDENRDDIQVDVRQLPTGLYRLKINAESSFFYIDTSNEEKPGNMYVSIYNVPHTNPQAILTATGKAKKTRFTVAFAARRALWKYKTRTTIIDEIKDTDGKYLFKADGAKQFVSLRPIPFSNTAMKSLVAKDGGSNLLSPLPNPTADRLLAAQNGIYTTETFINY